MAKDGTIIIIEDELDDQFVLEEIFIELEYPNKRIYFPNGASALYYLNKTIDRPFIIISDIDLPQLSGVDLTNKIQLNTELRHKCIPYVFFTTLNNQQAITDCYCKSVQGFFIKPSSYQETKDTVKLIMDYWTRCVSPYIVNQYAG